VAVFYGDQDLTSERFAKYQPDIHFKNHQEMIEALKSF
jgi:hypothetical protein